MVMLMLMHPALPTLHNFPTSLTCRDLTAPRDQP
jgi:hypothetical protein